MIENLWICINGVVPIFFLVGLGIFLRKWNVADEVFGEKATTLVFRLVLPVMIFGDIATAEFGGNFSAGTVIYALASSALMFVVSQGIACLVSRDNRRRAAFSQGAFRANYAILGLPLTKALFGAGAVANGTVILAASMVFQNIFAVICLEGFLNKKGGIKSTIMGILKNPIIIAAVLGTVVCASGFTMPTPILRTVNYIGDMCVPLSLITVGISMRLGNIKETLALSFSASFLKTALFPILFLVPAIFMGFSGEDLGVLYIFWTAPSAVAGYAMIRNMGGDYDLYGNIIVISTFLSFLMVFFGVFIMKNIGIL
ncbi:MAG: AEC family transporter [Clostridia bacterium]|nr:AEC family transporter [Clostridia bacterium]